MRTSSPARDDPAVPRQPAHRVALPGGRWALWRWSGLRAAGFPFALAEALAAPGCAAAADRPPAEPGYREAFQQALRRTTAALAELAADERFREAIAWQNRQVLRNTLDPLVREAPEVRNRRRRRREATVASYLQRYCAKNDTIGFFGPVGWARWVDEDGLVADATPGRGLLARRTVYFEGWAVDALAAALSRDRRLRPWLEPRANPAMHLDGLTVHRPHGSPLRLAPLEAAVLAACRGGRTARQVAVELLWSATPGLRNEAEVLAVLEGLQRSGLLSWGLDLPVEAHPERRLRRLLERVEDAGLRAQALRPLDELEAARAQVAEAAGSPERLDRALGALETTFTRLTGAAATRSPGRFYAGRTPVYEDCRRDLELTLGPAVLRALGPPLSLALDGARWLTFAIARAYRQAFRELHADFMRRSGRRTMPLGRLSFMAHPLLFGDARPLDGVVRSFQDRWLELLALPPMARRVEHTSDALRPRVQAAFPAPGPGWASACYQSPDVMIAAPSLAALGRGDFQLVLGELHLGLNTLDARWSVAQHPRPQELATAVEQDITGRRVLPIFPKDWPEVTSRTYPPPALLSESFHYLALGPDAAPAGKPLALGELVVEDDGDGLLVRTRDGRLCFDVVEVFAELLTLASVNCFRLLPPLAHTPRVTIDRLVVAREAWRFPPAACRFAADDEAARFRAARRWAREHGLPRHVFVRAPAEPKPYFVDLDSPPLVDLLAAVVRRSAEVTPDRPVVLTEMLPTPEQAWLPDADGRRYTSELRLVAVDGAAGP
jgi:Lantibiotic dehydratase, N terminus